VKHLPAQYDDIRLSASPLQAVRDADALVIATEWPEYRAVSMSETLAVMHAPQILDANRFLSSSVEALPEVTYVTVGKAIRT
jgi:UDPglucose 6-dehydrogenase